MVHSPPVKWYTISLLWNSSGRKKSSLVGKALWKVVINQEEKKESILMWHSQSTKAKTSPHNIKSYPGPIPWSVKGRKKELQVPAFVFFLRDFGMPHSPEIQVSHMTSLWGLSLKSTEFRSKQKYMETAYSMNVIFSHHLGYIFKK